MSTNQLELPKPGLITNPDNIPVELRDLPWIIYRCRLDITKHGPKIKKPPVDWRNPTQYNYIDPTDPQFWCTFEQAVDVMRADPSGELGIAVALTREAGVLCLDLDTSSGAEAFTAAAARLAQYNAEVQTYGELSLNGGWHMFYRARLPHGMPFAGFGDVEFRGGGYICVTGNTLPMCNGHLADWQSVIDENADQFPAPQRATGGVEADGPRVVGWTDAEVLEIMEHDFPSTFATLMSGADMVDRSMAFTVIVGDLDKITGDPEQIRRIVAASPCCQNGHNRDRFTREGRNGFDNWISNARASNVITRRRYLPVSAERLAQLEQLAFPAGGGNRGGTPVARSGEIVTLETVRAEMGAFLALALARRVDHTTAPGGDVSNAAAATLLSKMAMVYVPRPEVDGWIGSLAKTRLCGTQEQMHSYYKRAVIELMNQRKAAGIEGGNWTDKLQTSEYGTPLANVANCRIALEGLLGEERLRHDSFRDKCIITDDRGNEEVLTDHIHHTLLNGVQTNGYPQAKKTDLRDAVIGIAKDRSQNDLTERLRGLSGTWDGVERVETWLQKYVRVADTPHMRKTGALILLQAVARGLYPGCKADQIPVLIGPQGARKSTLWRTLSLGWYAEFVDDFSKKDGLEQMRGKWAVELAEMSAMDRKETEAAKAFITKQEDDYRKSYGYENEQYLRQFYLCGSSNPTPFLKDYTGTRRFLCCEVAGRIDIEGLKESVLQLYAEALVQFERMGGVSGWWQWTAEPAFVAMQEALNEKWREVHPWEDAIADYVAGATGGGHGRWAAGSDHCHEFVSGRRRWIRSATVILRDVVGLSVDRQANQRDANMVGKILGRLGYERGRVRVGQHTFTGYRQKGADDGA